MDLGNVASYLAGFVVMAGIYSVFALGLNVQWGHTACSTLVSPGSSL